MTAIDIAIIISVCIVSWKVAGWIVDLALPAILGWLIAIEDENV